MNSKTSLLFSICIWTAASSCCFAATIPSGTTLLVRTLNPISSHQRVGRTVKLEIDQDVLINGKVVLQAGTAASGVVETSVGDLRRSDALTVNLTSVSINGKTVPVKTTGAYEPQLPGTKKTSRGASVYVRDYTFPHNTRMAFRLAQPVNL
jgi:hypothetical protein